MSPLAALEPTTSKLDRPAKVHWLDTTPLTSRPWLLAALSAISELAALPHNWDGYGSPRIGSSALVKAIQLASVVGVDELPVPEVCPISGGGIGLQWEVGDRELEFTIYPNGTIRYLKVIGPSQERVENLEDGNLVSASRIEVRPLVRWLLSA
jgi:hypothetical protein